MTTGDRVRALREERGFTGKELAQAAGVDGAQVTRLEAGERMPTALALLRIARVLGTSIEWILTGQGVREPGAVPDPRELAAQLAGDGGVDLDAVRIVESRALRPEERALPALYWIDQMRAEEVRARTARPARRRSC